MSVLVHYVIIVHYINVLNTMVTAKVDDPGMSSSSKRKGGAKRKNERREETEDDRDQGEIEKGVPPATNQRMKAKRAKEEKRKGFMDWIDCSKLLMTDGGVQKAGVGFVRMQQGDYDLHITLLPSLQPVNDPIPKLRNYPSVRLDTSSRIQATIGGKGIVFSIDSSITHNLVSREDAKRIGLLQKRPEHSVQLSNYEVKRMIVYEVFTNIQVTLVSDVSFFANIWVPRPDSHLDTHNKLGVGTLTRLNVVHSFHTLSPTIYFKNTKVFSKPVRKDADFMPLSVLKAKESAFWNPQHFQILVNTTT